MKRSRTLLLTLTLPILGCGPSIDTLNHLAQTGQIHQAAPVKATVSIEIAASPTRVWGILTNVPAWPKHFPNIDSTTATTSLASGTSFVWKAGSSTIHSQVQLFEPTHRLAWTGTAMTAKAIHVWTLTSTLTGTTVTIDESMDGPFMQKLYPSTQLAEDDTDWLKSLKQAVESH